MSQIDSAMKGWAKKLGKSWGLPNQDVVLTIAADEIRNRIENYPSIRESLSELPFDIKQFADNVRSWWVMGGRSVVAHCTGGEKTVKKQYIFEFSILFLSYNYIIKNIVIITARLTTQYNRYDKRDFP